jgi:transcription elongation factor Elf1
MLFDFPAIESDRGYAMRAETQWTELLTCPNCGQSGPVHLSQPEGRVYDMSVEAVPAGFKVVRMAYGETFFCKACNRQAVTKYPGPLYSTSK